MENKKLLDIEMGRMELFFDRDINRAVEFKWLQ